MKLLSVGSESLATFNFHTASGALEIALHEDYEQGCNNQQSRPAWVTQLLTKILKNIGDEKIEDNAKIAQCIAELCVADRQFILLQWRLQESVAEEWLTAQCPACDAFYDFPMDWHALPIKPAATTFPFASVTVAEREMVFRVPNGQDQEFIAGLVSRGEATEPLSLALARRLIVAETETIKTELSALLTMSDVPRIESAIEAIAPELADRLTLQCPECTNEHNVNLDVYRGLLKPVSHLLDDVHRLALHYHWSEKDILDMPKKRRVSYLQRVDSEKRVAGAGR
jgi:hypothetical protein